MITLKKINIKYQPYYFLSDMINIKNFDSSLLSIDKTSLKSIDAVTYHIKYMTMKILDHGNIDLIFASTDKAKKYQKGT